MRVAAVFFMALLAATSLAPTAAADPTRILYAPGAIVVRTFAPALHDASDQMVALADEVEEAWDGARDAGVSVWYVPFNAAYETCTSLNGFPTSGEMPTVDTSDQCGPVGAVRDAPEATPEDTPVPWDALEPVLDLLETLP